MIDTYARRIRATRLHSLVRQKCTLSEVPGHAMRCSLDAVDLYSTRPAFGVHTAEPQMMLTRPVNETLEARRQVFQPFDPCIKRIDSAYRKAYLG